MMTWLERSVMRSWWLILFALFSFGLYEQGLRSKNRDYALLKDQLHELNVEHAKLAKLKENLLLQVNSQSDPDWIELVLIKGLGLIPENHTKVFFTTQESPTNQPWTH